MSDLHQSGSLALVREPATLAELAQTANHESQMAFEAGTRMIQHAINCGEALLEAKTHVPRGEWTDWLAENFERSLSVAHQCMRIARHKSKVIDAQATNFKGALRVLHGGRPSNIDPAEEAYAKKLRAEGMTYSQIATHLDVPKSRVQRYLNPASEKARLERAKRVTIAGRRELNRQARDRDAKKAGGAIAEAYALIRKTLQTIDVAIGQEKDRDVKHHLNDAVNRLHNAEDAIVKASRRSAA